MDRLIANFHALEGDTLQEKRKSFNRLLTQIEQELITNEDLGAFTSALVPKNKLEEILKVEILLKFQRNDALLNILKGGNVVLIRKVLNCWRFFETAFIDISAETLVNDIFPHTSFSTRMKSITKLAINLKSEELADSYFEAINKKYGLQVATAILPACNLNLIKSMVGSFRVQLSERQILQIYKKYPEFLIWYFDAKGKTDGYGKVIKHVARVDGELFWKIQEKYKYGVKFGRHMTSYMYANERLKKYHARYFNAKKVYAILKNDERKLHEFFLTLYPKDIQDFYHTYSYSYDNTLTNFIRRIPRDKRYAIVSACFKELYGKNLSEYNTNAMPENLLKIVPLEERKVIIDQKVLKDESCMYMWPANKAIKAIQERIKYTTDAYKREQLILLLYTSCAFNNDQKALLNLLKYISSKYKNSERILIPFINQLGNWKHLEKLSDEHWSLINELIKPLLMNSRLYNDFKFTTSYFKRRMDANGEPDESLKFLVKKMTERRSFYHIINEQKMFDKKNLEHLAALIPKMYEGDEYQEAAVWLLMAIVQYNKQDIRKIPVSNYPNFIQVAKSYLSKENPYEAIAIFKYCVQEESHSNVEYDHIFWEHYEKLYDAEILLWYLRNKPLTVFQNIDEILKHTSSHILNNRLTSIFKLFSMYNFRDDIMEKIINFARNSLKVDNLYTANFAIMALAHLTDPQAYFSSTSFLYPPEDGKIDYEETDKAQLEVQEALAKSLTAIQNPDLCLPSLLIICKGDYLKYAYKPLYNIATHMSEINFDRFFETLFNSAVSVRKHAVCLITLVCPKENVYSFLKQVGESDKHATLQKVVFKNTLKYFLSQQSEVFWDLLRCNIQIIDKDDTEAYEHLVNVKKIPPDYLARYVQLIYEILTGHETKQIQDKKWDLLRRISDDVIKDLDKEFLEKVIIETLFTQNCDDFWLKCVFHTTGQNKEEMLLFTFDLFKNYYNRHVPDPTSIVPNEVLRNIHAFVSDFCHQAAMLNADETLMKRFIELWSETVTKKGFDEELLELQLTQDYLTCHSEDIVAEFVDKVNLRLINWVKEHGDASVMLLFSKKLYKLLLVLIKPWEYHEKFITFLEKFCSPNDIPYNCNYAIAVILLSRRTEMKSFTKHYDGVIAKLQEFNVPTVRIRLRKFLKSLVA